MADPTNSINNKRQFASELETKPLAISEYEHLEVLFETEETVGEVPSKRGRAVDQANLTAATSAPKVWRTRRRRDGKVCYVAAPLESAEARSLTLAIDVSSCGICRYSGCNERGSGDASSAVESSQFGMPHRHCPGFQY